MHSLRPKAAALCLFGAVWLFSCKKEATPEPDNTPNLRPLTTAESNVVASANEFAFRSFAQVRAEKPQENMFISPLSISTALTMAYYGADGSTKEAIRQTLGLQPTSDEELGQAYRGLNDLLVGMDRKVTFLSANSIWHAQWAQLQAPFVQLNTTYLGASTQAVDFSSPTAKDAINGWVNQKTNGKIPTLLSYTAPDFALVLLNAIYFKGTWKQMFDKQKTYTGNFRRADGSTQPGQFMVRTGGQYLQYADASKLLVDLPYGNGQFSMTLLVPQGQSQLADLSGELTAANLTTWLTKAAAVSHELHMPKFKVEYPILLNRALQQMGMAEAFHDRANFSRMLVGSRPLKVSEVRHKAYVEVDEAGSEAAAATAVIMTRNSAGAPQVIRIDRPFVFLIREKSSNSILFIGQLTGL